MSRPTMEEMEICKCCGRKTFEVGKGWTNGLCDECVKPITDLDRIEGLIKKLEGSLDRAWALVEKLESFYKK